MRWLVLALAVSQWPGAGLEVRDEGVRQGYAVRVDCVGTGVTCTRSGATWTLGVTTGGGGGTPAGSTTQVQFNNGGSFGADVDLTYNSTTNTLTVPNLAGTASAAAVLSTSGSTSQYWRGDNSWQAVPNPPALSTSGTTAQYWRGDNSWQTIPNPPALSTSGTTTQFWRGDNSWATPSASATPAGATTQVQFNNNGSFGADVDLTYNSTTNTLSVTQVSGNASTATALSTAGTTSQFWRGDNTWAAPPVGGGGYATIAEEGGALTQRATVNFVGSYMTCADNGPATRTDCTLSAIDLSTNTAATALPVAKGGLGKTTLTSAGAIPVGTAGTTTYTDLAGGAVGTVLVNSAANTPAWLTTGSTAGLSLLTTAGGTLTWDRPGYRVTGSNWTNGTTTISDITGLSWPVANGVPQAFRCTLAVLNSNAGSAIRYAVNGPTMTTVAFKTKMHKASVTTEVNENFTAVSASFQTAGVTSGVSTTAHIDTIEGVIIPSANGTMQIRGGGSAAQTSTVYRGSSCFVY